MVALLANMALETFFRQYDCMIIAGCDPETFTYL